MAMMPLVKSLENTVEYTFSFSGHRYKLAIDYSD